MLETAIALVFAHVLADFLLQSDFMVRKKRRLRVLAQHIAIVTALTWTCLGFSLEPLMILLIAGSHAVIDWAKARWAGDGFLPFALDQSAHLAMIAVAAVLYPEAFASGLWAAPDLVSQLPWLERIPQAMALGAGLVATVWGGGYAVAALMRDLTLAPEPPPDRDISLPRGGRLIGRLERLLILVLVLSEQTPAIGLLIAAKSILRFGEASRDRRASEYVIIGTLASVAWALVMTYLTEAALSAP